MSTHMQKFLQRVEVFIPLGKHSGLEFLSYTVVSLCLID